MHSFKEDQPPFYCNSESELFTSDLLQLYKTSESIRVNNLHLISIQEVKKTEFFDLSWKESEMCETIKCFISLGIA